MPNRDVLSDQSAVARIQRLQHAEAERDRLRERVAELEAELEARNADA